MNALETSSMTILPAATAATPGTDATPADTVGARASAAVVKVPSWFTASAALRVCQLKRVSHVLVVERGAVVGAAAARALAAAAASDPVCRSMVSSVVSVSPDTARDEAWRLMSLQGLDCLPIVSGPLLVGVITRDDLLDDAALAAG